MNYTTLVADKSTVGSLASWVNYAKLQPTVIVDEAQSLLYGMLRTREMMASFQFAMAAGDSYVALPARFLDPIGRIRLASFNSTVRHQDANSLQTNRTFTESSGTLGADPFTTTDGSDTVSVVLDNHGFTQEAVFNVSGATAFNGVTLNGTFPITVIVDADTFQIDISSLGSTPSASGAGGGSDAAYLCDSMSMGIPYYFAIWDERIHFDVAFYQASLCQLQYYQSLPLLSSTNQSNFLTDRYPRLLRQACITMAADFMKDTTEYQKNISALSAMVEQVSIENDMQYRGMELEAFTP